MSLSQQLKILAKGINPDTGEILNSDSIANTPAAIRMLFTLAEELSDYEKPRERKNKLSPEERRAKTCQKESQPIHIFRGAMMIRAL